jgi:phage host-nuclease inhibitor protein Gam
MGCNFYESGVVMFSAEATIALVMMEILLLVGFLGVIVVIMRFSAQMRENLDNITEVIVSEVKKVKEEVGSYREEIDAYQRAEKEKIFERK